jgi:hypothetical protein
MCQRGRLLQDNSGFRCQCAKLQFAESPQLGQAGDLRCCLIVDLPNLCIAWKTSPRCLAALWAGVFSPLLQPGLVLLLLFDVIPSGGLSNTRDPSMALAYAAVLGLLCVSQIATFVAALIAYYANRRIPGFLPDASWSAGRMTVA